MIKIDVNCVLCSVTLQIIQCQPERKKGKKLQENKKAKNGLYGLTVSNTDCQTKAKQEKRTRSIWADTANNTVYLYIYPIRWAILTIRRNRLKGCRYLSASWPGIEC